MAQEAIGDETNPYLQAKRIHEFVGKKVHFKVLDFERGRGVTSAASQSQESFAFSVQKFSTLSGAKNRKFTVGGNKTTLHRCPAKYFCEA